MAILSFIRSIPCIDGTQNHDWIVLGEYDVECIHCRNVKNIRNDKIYQWSEN